MSEGTDHMERPLGRDEMLRLAAIAGGAVLLGGPAAAAEAARTRLAGESGRLKVLDWVGYGNDGGQAMFAAYVKAHPKNKPQFTHMTNEADALGKIRAGLYLGFKNPWRMNDDQLKKAQKLLISKKHLVRMFWASEADLWEAFGSGDLWIAYAWPNDWVQMKKKKLKVVYMHPKEKPVAWVGMFMLLKGTPRPHLAHSYVNAWSSKRSAKWLEDNYGYGHANVKARPSSSDLLRALQLTNPKAVTEPNAHLDRDIPRRALYAKTWEQVKSS